MARMRKGAISIMTFVCRFAQVKTPNVAAAARHGEDTCMFFK